MGENDMSTSDYRKVMLSRRMAMGIGAAALMCVTAITRVMAAEETEPLIERYAINLADRKDGTEALVNAPLPLSIELEGTMGKRDLDFDNLGVVPSEMRRLGLSLGFDVTPWFTVRGLVGTGDFETSVGGVGRIDSGLTSGISAEYRLLNWQVSPEMSNISWIRCDACVRYLNGIAESGDDKAEWREGYADMTVRLVTTPHEPFREVDRMIVFLGPAVSWIDGTLDTAQGGEYEFSHDRLVGFTGGLILVPHANIEVKLGALVFSEMSYGAALRFHF